MVLMPIYSEFDVGKVVVEVRFEECDKLNLYRIQCDNRDYIEFNRDEDVKTFIFGEIETNKIIEVVVEGLDVDWRHLALIRLPVLDYKVEKTSTPLESRVAIPSHMNRNILSSKQKLTSDDTPSFYGLNGGYNYDYIVPYRPFVQDQTGKYKKKENGYIETVGYVNSCVANVASAMMECFQNAEGGQDYKLTSVSWIWGGVGESDEFGTMYWDAWDFLRENGSPPYELMLSEHVISFPDNYYLSDRVINGNTYKGARSIYNQKRQENLPYAQANRIDSWEQVDVTYPTDENHEETVVDAKRIQDAIMSITHSANRKAVIMTIEIDKTFEDVGSDGIVGDILDNGYSKGGHALLVVGWKKINGKRYWICQNSWGNNWGDNGLCYIRFSWSNIYIYSDGTLEGAGIRNFYILRDGTYPIPPMPKPKPPTYDRAKGVDGRDDGSVYVKWDKYISCNSYNLYYQLQGNSNIYVDRVEGTESKQYFGYAARRTMWITGINSDGTETLPSSKNIFTSAPNKVWSLSLIDYSNGIKVKAEDDWPTYNKTSLVVNRYDENTSYLDVRENPWVNGTNPYYFTWDGIDLNREYRFVAYGKLVVDGVTILSTRPSNTLIYNSLFNWDVPKVVGQDFWVTTTEWVRFMDAINKKLQQKGKPIINYTRPNAGGGFTAVIFNQARTGLVNLSASNVPPIANRGGLIYASYFSQLQNALNNVK